jgi:DNA-binding winged helix-turn-helix (wHTH) protein
MQVNRRLTFGLYRFDPHTRQLWRGKQEVRLTGKASAVLRSLLDRVGQVVTKDELFAAVWPDSVVSDAALTSCVQELRHALHDNARKPCYIETVHRRGFRFLGKVDSRQYSVVSRQEEENQKSKGKGQKSKVEHSSPAPSTQHPALTVVGREPDLAFLHERLEKAVRGARQLIFVTGEPGIGKTTLV